MREPPDSLRMTALESSKIAGSCSVPAKKLPRLSGASTPFPSQFALKLLCRPFPRRFTQVVFKDLNVDQRQKPHIRLELLDTSRRN